MPVDQLTPYQRSRILHHFTQSDFPLHSLVSYVQSAYRVSLTEENVKDILIDAGALTPPAMPEVEPEDLNAEESTAADQFRPSPSPPTRLSTCPPPSHNGNSTPSQSHSEHVDALISRLTSSQGPCNSYSNAHSIMAIPLIPFPLRRTILSNQSFPWPLDPLPVQAHILSSYGLSFPAGLTRDCITDYTQPASGHGLPAARRADVREKLRVEGRVEEWAIRLWRESWSLEEIVGRLRVIGLDVGGEERMRECVRRGVKGWVVRKIVEGLRREGVGGIAQAVRERCRMEEEEDWEGEVMGVVEDLVKVVRAGAGRGGVEGAWGAVKEVFGVPMRDEFLRRLLDGRVF
ncbi:MAG: hypothetical protein Q9227_004617 [Pyrenula ochraceoflavens]